MPNLSDLANAAQSEPPADATAALALAEDACRALAALTDRDRCDPQAVHRAVDGLFSSIHRGLAQHERHQRRESRRCPVCIGVPTDCVCTRPTRGVVNR